MSHSMVIVLVEPSGADVESEVNRLMAPFDETLEMPEYEVTCWCVGREAKKEADEALEKEMGTWDEARSAHDAKYAERKEKREALFADLGLVQGTNVNREKMLLAQINELEAESQKTWQTEFYEPRQKFYKSVFDASPKKDSPDADCTDCSGTGKHVSTSNEKAKWDWWRIGGRWDGFMLALPGIDDGKGGFNFGDEFESLKRNSCPVPEIKMKTTPFAVLTPDGEWHERGDMGWWGNVSDEKDKDVWWREYRELLATWKECTAVSVDVHI